MPQMHGSQLPPVSQPPPYAALPSVPYGQLQYPHAPETPERATHEPQPPLPAEIVPGLVASLPPPPPPPPPPLPPQPQPQPLDVPVTPEPCEPRTPSDLNKVYEVRLLLYSLSSMSLLPLVACGTINRSYGLKQLPRHLWLSGARGC